MNLSALFQSESMRDEEALALSTGYPQCAIAGIPVDCLTMEQATAHVVNRLQRRSGARPFLIMGPNAQLVTLAQHDIRFIEALRASALNVPDGISIVLASRLLGRGAKERVPGGELMESLCRRAAMHGLSVYLLGGLPGAATGAAFALKQRYPGLIVSGTYCPPRGFEHDPEECARIRERILCAAPDLLFVAFGAPRQEVWMHQNCPSLPIGAAMSVGAAFDTLAGLRKRAPLWTQKIGMEWLYRLCKEPRRLWRRYLIGNAYFVYLVCRQLFLKLQLRPQETLPEDDFFPAPQMRRHAGN